MKLGVLVSGRGSNLEAVLDAVRDGRLPDVEPVLVVSNRPGIRALEVAAAHRVPARVLALAEFGGDRPRRDAAIGHALREAGAELALLAGYDRVLSLGYFAAFSGRTINIHPSLLPRHGGAGMLGDAVHRAVLAAGDRETGASVHEVTSDVDAGPILAQMAVPIEPSDSPERLAERVLRAEHRLLVATLRDLAASSGGGTDGASMPVGARPASHPT